MKTIKFNTVNEKFIFNFYYTKYKEFPIGSRIFFKKYFIKKHGRYEYLQELIEKIEFYQFRTYGTLIVVEDWRKLR